MSSNPGPALDIYRTVAAVRAFRSELRKANQTLGFVPTMGALHSGHISLVEQAAAENDAVVVSIYVNPTQFGVHEDLDSYPQTWDADLARLETLNARLRGTGARGLVKAVFAPATRVMYPVLPPTSEINGTGSFVTISPLGQVLEGASRPVFFRGVATVCMKLFNIVAPDTVYFGQKDVQQTVVIRRMVQDFHLDIQVRIGKTLREVNGLAMSSRNVYLGDRRFRVGAVLYRALQAAEAQIRGGKMNRPDILQAANDVVRSERATQEALQPDQRALFDVDYISIADPDTMEELDEVVESKGAVISGAIKMMPVENPSLDEDCGLGGGIVPVRLIDNIIVGPAAP